MDYDILGLKVGLQFDEKASMKNLQSKLDEIQKSLKEGLTIQIDGVQQAVIDLKKLTDSMNSLSSAFSGAFSNVDMTGLTRAMETINRIDSSLLQKTGAMKSGSIKTEVDELKEYQKALDGVDKRFDTLSKGMSKLDSSLATVPKLMEQLGKIEDFRNGLGSNEMSKDGLVEYEKQISKIETAFDKIEVKQERSKQLEKELIQAQNEHLQLVKKLGTQQEGGALHKEYGKQTEDAKERLKLIQDTIRSEKVNTDSIKEANEEYSRKLKNIKNIQQATIKTNADNAKSKQEADSLKAVEDRVNKVVEAYERYKNQLSAIDEKLKTGTGVNRAFTNLEKATAKLSTTNSEDINTKSLTQADKLLETMATKYGDLVAKQKASEEVTKKITSAYNDQVKVLGKLSSPRIGENTANIYTNQFSDSQKLIDSLKEQAKADGLITKEMEQQISLMQKLVESAKQMQQAKLADAKAKNQPSKTQAEIDKEKEREGIYKRINDLMNEQISLIGKLSSATLGENTQEYYNNKLQDAKNLANELQEQASKNGIITEEMQAQIDMSKVLVENAERLRQAKIADASAKSLASEQKSLENSVSKMNKEYDTLISKIDKIDDDVRDQNKEYKNTLQTIKEIKNNLTNGENGLINPLEVKAYEDSLKQLRVQLEQLQGKQVTKNSGIDNYIKQLQSLYSQLLKNMKVVDTRNSGQKTFYEGETQAIEKKIETLTKEIAQNGLLNDSIKEVIATMQQQVATKQALNSAISGDKETELISRLGKQYDNLGVKLQSLRNKYEVLRVRHGSAFETDSMEAFDIKLKQLENSFRSLDVTDSKTLNEMQADIKMASAEMGNLQSKAQIMVAQMQQASGGIGKGVFLGSVMSQLAMLPINSFQQSVSAVLELDSALNTLQITMNASQSEMDSLVQGVRGSARELGTTYEEIMNISKIYANANESIDSIMDKIKPTAILATVSGIGAEQATSTVQAVMNQFSSLEGELTEKTQRIADVFIAVSRSLAMDFGQGIQEMSEGISQSGSVAEQAGVQFEEYVAMLASTMEITRLAGSQVGNAFKTIFSRMGRVSSGDILFDTETTEENINDMEKALEGLGIKLRDSKLEFRDTGEVLKELSGKWKTLSSAEQSYIAEVGAGVRQKNIFLALMEAMSGEAERYTTLLGEATNAEGASTKAQEIYMQSLEAKMNMLKATTTEMWQTLINSDIIGAFVTGLNTVVQGIGSLANAFSSLGGHTLPIVLSLTVATTALGKGMGGIVGTFTTFKAGLSELNGVFKDVIFGMRTTNAQGAQLSSTAIKTATSIRTLTSALAGIGVGLAISLIISAIQSIAQSAERARESIEKMVNAYEEQASKVSSIETLIQRQKELTEVLEKGQGTTEELYNTSVELASVEKEIAEILPNATTAWDENGKAKAGNIEINEQLLESEKEVQRILMENVALAGKADAEKASQSLENLVKKQEEYKQRLVDAYEELNALEEKRANGGVNSIEIEKINYLKILIQNLSGDIEKQGEKIKTNAETVDYYNKTIQKLNQEEGQNYSLVKDLIGVYQELGVTKDKVTEATEKYGKALEEEQRIAKQIEELESKITDGLEEAFASPFENGQEQLDKLMDKAQAYQGILKDIIDKNGNFDPDGVLSASTIQTIIRSHQELVPYLDSEKSLYDYIVGKLQEYGNEAQNAYSAMIANSEEYYNAHIKNSAQWESLMVSVMNNLKKVNYDYYKANAENMQKELKNAKTVAQARAIIETNAIKALATGWSKYYQRIADMNNPDFIGPHQSNEQLEAERKKLQAMSDSMKNLLGEIDSVVTSIDIPSSVINSITSPTGGSTSSKKNDVSDLELVIDRYYKLKKAIEDVNHALEMNRLAQQNASGKNKIALLEEENRLLAEQKKKYEALRQEQLRERSELKGKLKDQGFSIDNNNQITNYAEKLKALQNWANGATGDEKKKRQERVKEIEELVNSFISLNESIHDTTETMTGFDNEIADNKEEMKDYYNELLDKVGEVEDKITQALEKQIEKRRKAIEEEYNQRVKMLQKTKELYNKQNEEEDYKNELHDEQQKLTELQNAINIAMRDTSNAGRARLAELQKEYAEQQKKIQQMITEHERDKANDRFDEEIEQAEKEKEDALNSFDAKYDEKAIAQMVTELIANGWTSIGDEIIKVEDIYRDFEDMFGDGLTILGDKIKDEFIGNLKEAQEIIKNMGDIYGQLGLSAPSGISNYNTSRSGFATAYSIGESSADSAPAMMMSTSNSSLGEGSIGGTVLSRAKRLEDFQVMGDSISNVTVNFESLMNVQGNVMKDLVPQLNDVVQKAVKEMDKTISGNLKARLGQL